MASVTTLLASLLFLAGRPVEAKAPYCLPGNPCFPSENVLDAFNATIGGRLIKAQPYGAACYNATYDANQCQALAKAKLSADFRDQLPAAVMFPNFEQTQNGQGCPVPDLKPDGSAPDPVNGQCTIGAMSQYVVNATSADDIAKSVQFASAYNLRLRIKNTGHDYAGRSTGQGSFAVWTHYMNDVKFIKGFVPAYSYRSAQQDVLSAGPGLSVNELYLAGAEYGVATIGGVAPTVGAAGGYVLGGGAGPFGPKFGLGVDNVVQFEVVTADGRKRVANEFVNSDLFWALRGGGGAFAVVTRVYFKAYPAFTTVNTIFGQVVCQNSSSFAELVGAMVDLQLPLREANQTGEWLSNPGALTLVVLSFEMFTATQQAKPTNETLQAFHTILSVPGCQPQVQAVQTTGTNAWINAYTNIVIPVNNAGAPVGLSTVTLSRAISYDTITNPAGRAKIKQELLNSSIPLLWQNTIGDATTKVASNATAVNPGFRKAFGFVDAAFFGPWNGFTIDSYALINQTNQVLDKVFGDVVYYNEQYPLGRGWQESYFGSNYPRLLEIKNQVDPNGVFSCPDCVGSEAGY